MHGTENPSICREQEELWRLTHRQNPRITGIEPWYDANGSYNEYVKLLPKWNGRSHDGNIRELISSRGNITLLDVGCGLGNGLRLPEELRQRVARYGITATDFRNIFRRIQDGIDGLKINAGDAHQLTDYYPRGVFDMVVSSRALFYMDESLVLPGIVDVLSPGGIALLGQANTTIASGLSHIEDLEINVEGVSFRKKG